MGDINLPMLSKSSNFNDKSPITSIDEDEELNLPFTLGNCVTFHYRSRLDRFNFNENTALALEITEGVFRQTEVEDDIAMLKNPRNLNSPSFLLKFGVTLVFIFLILLVGIILLYI